MPRPTPISRRRSISSANSTGSSRRLRAPLQARRPAPPALPLSLHQQRSANMNRSRAVLILVVVVLSAVMAGTAPYLVRHTKIGLEFRGGYELTFTADPLETGGAVSPQALTKTAEILSERANATGVS